ncbi:hypothetical protein HSX11_06000 [Oxalobacteraceae bacterium]|nr:hypothetical protein [Oxalobacteraceae bacterium]
MKALKNFEALFVVTLGLACAANYVFDKEEATMPPAVASIAVPMSTAAPQVVVVSAKRMTAEEKRQSLADERKSLASASTADKI